MKQRLIVAALFCALIGLATTYADDGHLQAALPTIDQPGKGDHVGCTFRVAGKCDPAKPFVDVEIWTTGYPVRSMLWRGTGHIACNANGTYETYPSLWHQNVGPTDLEVRVNQGGTVVSQWFHLGMNCWLPARPEKLVLYESGEPPVAD